MIRRYAIDVVVVSTVCRTPADGKVAFDYRSDIHWQWLVDYWYNSERGKTHGE